MPEELRQEVSEQNRIRLEKLRALQAEEPRPLPHHPLRPDPSLQRDTGQLRGAGRPDRLHRRPHDVAPRDGQGQPSPTCSTATARSRSTSAATMSARRPTSSSRTSTSATSSALRASIFRTKMGEVSVHAQKVTLLTKCLHPLPEKFHGLKDMDTRYRQRYLDMIVNPRGARYFRQALADHQGHPRVHGRSSATSRSITPRARHAGDRRGGPALRHPPQRAGYRHVPAHRDGAAFEAPHRRRPRARLRSGPHLPQRGHGHAPQPRVHLRGDVSGLHRLPRHDGLYRGALQVRGQQGLRHHGRALPGRDHPPGRRVGAA